MQLQQNFKTKNYHLQFQQFAILSAPLAASGAGISGFGRGGKRAHPAELVTIKKTLRAQSLRCEVLHLITIDS